MYIIEKEARMPIATSSKLAGPAPLSPKEKAGIVDCLFYSLEGSETPENPQWRKKVEDRINAYIRGEIKANTLDKVLAEYSH